MASDPLDEKAIFNVAREIDSADARADYLHQVCGADRNLFERVEILLSAYQEQASFLESPPTGSFAPTVAQSLETETPGVTIGHYKLLQQIGEGGMGTVFMAEQTEPVRRKVALKVIKAGMDSRQVIARFEAERQALAMMDHINIARVIDAGATDTGRPYFVMELVHGVPITQYCDENQLTPRERLELFVPVCQAIQHAHQKGVIHRDIKPSNVLVTLYDGRPVPKVIDFGVAKATQQKLTERTLFTQYGTMVGTLEYMSPEQAEMSGLGVDTRSDIYSLGVLLYELLTGNTPLSHQRVRGVAFAEILRLIQEEEPLKPSSRLSESGEALPSISAQRHMEPAKLTKLLRGELDWIVMKCLEKNRNRRYESASGFAMDVQRYLADEPVLACPPSAGYRLRKFARKNRKLMAFGAVVAALLVTTTVASIFAAAQSARLADKQHELRSTAERRADEERKAKDELEWNLYLQRIALVQQELLAENTGRAEELLDECPAHLRGWEWRYLKRSRPGNPLALQSSHCAAFSPDGRYLATRTGQDLKLVDPTTGKTIRTLGGITSWVDMFGLAFYPKRGESVVAACDYSGKTVRLWNADTGQEIHNLAGHGDRLRTLAFSPNGQQLAVGSIDNGLRIWDWRAGQLLFDIPAPRAVSRITYSPDGRRVAVGVFDNDNDVIIYDAVSWTKLRSFGKHSGGIEGLAYSPNGEQVATSGTDGLVKIWNEASGVLHRTLASHIGPVYDVAYTSDGRRIASAGWDKTIKFWDHSKTGKETLTLRGHADIVFKLAFSPEEHLLVSAGADGARLWNATPVGDSAGSEAVNLPGHASAVTSVAFSPDGRFLASAGFDRVIKLWNAASLGQNNQLTGDLSGHTDVVWSLAFSPDSRQLASVGRDDLLKIWDTDSLRELSSLAAGNVHNVAFDPHGRFLASSGGIRVRLWDSQTRQKLRDVPFGTGDVYGLALSPDSKYVAIGKGQHVQIYETTTAKHTHSCRHNGLVFGIAFSPDGKRLASASYDQTLKIWDPVTGQEIHTLRGHRDRVVSVAFSPDGKLLASGSGDSTVRLWDATLGEEIAVLRGHTGYVWGLAFSPDGKRLASTGGHHNSGEVTIWDISPYKPRDVRAELEEAVRRDPISAQAHCNLGIALSAQNRLDEAIACYKKAIELDTKHTIALDNLGRALARQNKLDEAIDVYKMTLENANNLVGPEPRLLARLQRETYALLHAEGRHAEAEQLFHLARAGWENYAANKQLHSRWELAWFLVTWPDPKLHDPSRAIELAEQLVKDAATVTHYWRVLGVAHLRAADWPAASAALEKANECANGGGAWEWYFLAMAHWQQEDKDEARRWYDHAAKHLEQCRGHADIGELLQIQFEAFSVMAIERGVEAAPPPREK